VLEFAVYEVDINLKQKNYQIDDRVDVRGRDQPADGVAHDDDFVHLLVGGDSEADSEVCKIENLFTHETKTGFLTGKYLIG
jgi:hypothetical protein